MFVGVTCNPLEEASDYAKYSQTPWIMKIKL